MRKIVIACPHLHVSGGVKVLLSVASRLALFPDLCVTVVVNRLDSNIRWLFPSNRHSFLVREANKANSFMRSADCIVDYLDEPMCDCGSVPRILLLQGFGNQSVEKHNLKFKFVTVVAVSEWLAEVARVFGHTNVHVIPPGLSVTGYIKPKKFVGGGVVLGCLYHPAENKGADNLIWSTNQLVKKGFRDKFLLRILSASVPKPQFLRSLKCRYEVVVNPQQTDLAAFYRSCYIWLASSRNEGFGLTTAEALFYGVPAVWVPSNGLAAFMQHDINCVIPEHIENTNLYNMELQVIRLFSDSLLYTTLAQNAHKTVASFTWDNFISRFTKILQSVC